MKFLCQTPAILQALQVVTRAIGAQQALPILGNVLLKVEGGRCTLSATDLELSIVSSIDAQVEAEGSLTVPAKALLNFVQYNNDAEVLFETKDGTQLKCSSAKAKANLAGEAAADYPAIPTIERQSALVVDSALLLDALHLVTFSCARTALRPVLSGVSVRCESGELILAATDSYRLSEIRLPLPGDAASIACIIPVKVLDELRSVLAGKKAGKGESSPTVEIVLSSQQVEFNVGSTRLLSRLIEGKFPDYKQIIPKETPALMQFPTGELMTAARRLHYFAKEANNNLTIRSQGGKVSVTTPQTAFGRDEAEVNAQVSGTDTRIALSSAYLLDFLSHVGGDTVEMKVSDGMHPAVFAISGVPRFLHLIMPLRLPEK